MNSTDKIPPGNDRIQSPLLATVRALATRGFGRIRGRSRSERRLQLIETLSLGGKRQLMLIVCDGQHFLIGGGSDSVCSVTPILPHAHTTTATVEVSSHANQPGDTVNHGRLLQ
jgi:flagellar biogenesis protein FliO